ncbi:peptidase C14, caspase domain-containing protein [Trametes gibbosa]|nr:peptidase C14, caspase domain-containing protein [Trametes gibbosa]
MSTPRRKALLVGVRAVPQAIPRKYDALGALKDTASFHRLLRDYYSYKDEDITILSDWAPDEPKESQRTDSDEQNRPTKNNIMNELRRLVSDAQPGDRFVFMYAGHGGQIKAEKDKYEIDHKDEILFAVDSKIAHNSTLENPAYENVIKDDDILEIFKGLPAKASCVMIFDCCHSGTAADLPDVTDSAASTPASNVPGRDKAKLNTVRPGTAATTAADLIAISSKHPNQPNLTSWSACEDAHSTTGNSKGGIFLTAFRKALTKAPVSKPLTHYDLLHHLSYNINKIADRNSVVSDIPVPQLGALWDRDILGMPFTL